VAYDSDKGDFRIPVGFARFGREIVLGVFVVVWCLCERAMGLAAGELRSTEHSACGRVGERVRERRELIITFRISATP
jgi:hypothetical protein